MQEVEIRGIHTALVTPFTEDGSVDLDAFTRICERQIDAGIHGLVACGTTGEAATLSSEEWASVIRRAVEVADGQVPVTAGVGTNNTASTTSNIRRARELGADAALLVFPYYNKPNPDGLRGHVAASLAEGMPTVLYHVPGRTAQQLDVELFGELTRMSGVVAVKEATGDLRYGGDLIRRTPRPVLSGDDFSWLGLMAQGGAGCVSVISNVAPAHTVAIYKAMTEGRTADARQGFAELWDLATFLFSDTNPVPAKACLAEIGLGGPDPRLPLAAFNGPSPRPLLVELGLC